MALVAQLHRDSRVLADRVRPLLRNDSVTRKRSWTILYSEKRIPVYSDHHAAQTEFGRQDVGIVRVKTTGYNQDGTAVITFGRTVMVYRRDHAPKVPCPRAGDQG